MTWKPVPTKPWRCARSPGWNHCSSNACPTLSSWAGDRSANSVTPASSCPMSIWLATAAPPLVSSQPTPLLWDSITLAVDHQVVGRRRVAEVRPDDGNTVQPGRFERPVTGVCFGLELGTPGETRDVGQRNVGRARDTRGEHDRTDPGPERRSVARVLARELLLPLEQGEHASRDRRLRCVVVSEVARQARQGKR